MVVLSTRPAAGLSSRFSSSKALGSTYLRALGSIGPLPNWNSYRCSSQRPKASKRAWCRSLRVWSPRIWMVRDTTAFSFELLGERAAEQEDLQGIEPHLVLVGRLLACCCWLP